MTYYDAAKKVLEQSDVPMKVDRQFQDFIDDVNKLLKHDNDDRGVFMNGLINDGRFNNPN